ncbi:rRNA-processing protein UTP23 [Purpureocillium lavendulum]|uniref:U three protein 23 n=1 Tax=Purpureocillium lavendulum TaxID=1247861 RepID=A0AB34G596_9HYPO|nr:rRNA-processing protein UTP23 [Purpureocillium lavendulum]
MGGKRLSHLPLLAAVPRAPFRHPCRVSDPLRRGLRDRRCYTSPASSPQPTRLPFRFETGVGLFAKRAPRPFPPPFLSPPSGSFSDPLSTHHQSRDRRAFVNGELIRGLTNGDDAVYASDYFVCANDGVGAWATRPRGHAGLWSRLILHFWAGAIEDELAEDHTEPDPVASLQTAYERTLDATVPHDWQGTTTACGAQLHYRMPPETVGGGPTPLLYVTNLGDCQVMVVRPRHREVIYKTKEQWHWFDCPRQLGTNSPDTPRQNAIMDSMDIEEGDVVLAMSDGVIDNLWEHEIVDSLVASISEWESGKGSHAHEDRAGGRNGGMTAAANDLVAAARDVAMDPFAESPFMEHAIEEGLASEGGKLDDISVVAALCIKNDSAELTMRGKRSKQYRKLMEQFSMAFGFREPYQVLVDAEMVQDSCRFKMELEPALQRTVHGKVKPMITQCEIRKLYAKKNEHGVSEAIEVAKTCERRRCGHHPDEYPEPLSTLECIQSVVDPKDKGENKHRYVVASQSQEVRRMLRAVRGVPLIYIKRSVMILEPMSDESAATRAREEKSKFRAEIKATLGKRKREAKDGSDDEDANDGAADSARAGEADAAAKKKKKQRGPKGPNPLSMKKTKTKKAQTATTAEKDGSRPRAQPKDTQPEDEAATDAPAKRKRRRRNKSGTTSDGAAAEASEAALEVNGGSDD